MMLYMSEFNHLMKHVTCKTKMCKSLNIMNAGHQLQCVSVIRYNMLLDTHCLQIYFENASR